MTSGVEAGPSSGPCRHLTIGKDSLKRYQAALRWGRRLRSGRGSGEDEDADGYDDPNDNRKRKLLAYPSCSTCKAGLHRPYICLECAKPACFLNNVEFPSDCMRQHLYESEHDIAFDIMSGTLYCKRCDDVVYNEDFDRTASKEHASIEPQKHVRRRIDALDSIQNGHDVGEEVEKMCKMTRGMYNLGATCFMNVVLQSFIHNPLLRNYFLSDRHNSALCPARENCLACELDTLFNEFFSSNTRQAPFAPTNFLFCIYLARESTELSNAGEHDAHELFIAALNSVHSALMAVGREPSSRSERLPLYPHGDQAYGLTASRSGSASNASEDGYNTAPSFRFSSDVVCPCVMHRTFSGVMQSDVTCQRCGWTSTTHDPFLDLSLDIRSDRARASSSFSLEGDFEVGGGKKKKKHKDEKTNKDRLLREGSGVDDEQTLTECMRRYCALEKLAQSDYSCAQCGVPSQAVKQLSICRLPPVLCFQLKRFEHHAAAGSKVETRVRFPLTFDMSEYCASTMRQEEAESAKVDAELHLYDLFTVVVHEGKLNTGHYYCYFRWRDSWFIANDDKTQSAKLNDVLSCRAYQLCYKRRYLQNVRVESAAAS